MNKLEIQAINGYWNVISDLANEINHGFEYEQRKFSAYTYHSPNSWDIYVYGCPTGDDMLPTKKLHMNLTTIYYSPKYMKEHDMYKPTPENFELAIEMLQEYLNETQEEEEAVS